MAKIGVGVGEDFPVNDKPEKPQSNANEQGERGEQGRYDPRFDFGGCGWARDGEWDGASGDWREQRRARRKEWRRHRKEWRQEHREWRRRFRDEMRARGYSGFGFFPFVPLALGIFILIALITGIVTIVASAPILVFGLLLLGVLYGAHKFRNFSGSDFRIYVADPRGGQHGPQSPPEEG
jgi:hypothetical protein